VLALLREVVQEVHAEAEVQFKHGYTQALQVVVPSL